jgi:uncharacterized protein YceH (UPF0502 family)
MNEPEANPSPQLSPVEARIVASLVEKQATTPDVYPLTLNAIVLACNQKTAREPVMQLEPGEVGHALRQLEGRGWVKSQHGSRADRYEHRLDAVLGVTRAQGALMALLMLRGPQTVNELLTRSDRLAEFGNAEDLQYALERLSQREPSLVRELPRQGGQRETRWAHLLSGEPVMPAAVAAEASPRAIAGTSALEQRIEALEARVAELEARLASLPGAEETGEH